MYKFIDILFDLETKWAYFADKASLKTFQHFPSNTGDGQHMLLFFSESKH